MKSPTFEERNKDGFDLKLACDKLVELCIKSITVTEYQDTCHILHNDVDLPIPITNNKAITPGDKLTFEHCISRLSDPIQREIVSMDSYLRSLKPLKFKRLLEKNGNKITYVASDYGVSYAIYLSNDVFDHSLQWYLITSGKPETWHRKADWMEETLQRLSEKRPEVAERLFYSLDDCVGCYQNCLARTKYQFGDKQKIACHGKMKFRMNVEGFEDVRTMVEEINDIAKVKLGFGSR